MNDVFTEGKGVELPGEFNTWVGSVKRVLSAYFVHGCFFPIPLKHEERSEKRAMN